MSIEHNVSQFETPVVIFFFKRIEKTVIIINRLAEIQPKKVYLISDGPRNDEESIEVKECRKRVEEQINWPCEIVRNYADINKGVYDRIGLGAQWVLSKEETAIFLEDDNLPETTFFRFCEEMLDRYRDDTRILWVCGTNYLKDYDSIEGASYVFTKHMMPCGWASWSHKFSKFYDGELSLLDDSYLNERVQYENDNKALCKQDMECWNREKIRIKLGSKPASWDYQMSFTMRVHGLYAIVPCVNQIKNIGVDEQSTHGGTNFSNIMTQRFCGLPTKPIHFPLTHPKVVLTDLQFEKRVANVILMPKIYRFKRALNKLLKKILLIDQNESLMKVIYHRLHSFISIKK